MYSVFLVMKILRKKTVLLHLFLRSLIAAKLKLENAVTVYWNTGAVEEIHVCLTQ